MKIKFDINSSEVSEAGQKIWCELEFVDDNFIIYSFPNAVMFDSNFTARIFAFVQNRFLGYRVVLFHMEEQVNPSGRYPKHLYSTFIKWEKK